MKDVDSALATLRIFNNPFRRFSSPVRPNPGIDNKMRDRQDSSRPGGLSDSGGNQPEGRTKPGKGMTRFTEGVADRMVAKSKIQPESFQVPQIGKPMVERVIYQKMPGSCDCASLFRTGRHLATDQTEACFHAELV
jgi:hypothetical protein